MEREGRWEGRRGKGEGSGRGTEVERKREDTHTQPGSQRGKFHKSQVHIHHRLTHTSMHSGRRTALLKRPAPSCWLRRVTHTHLPGGDPCSLAQLRLQLLQQQAEHKHGLAPDHLLSKVGDVLGVQLASLHARHPTPPRLDAMLFCLEVCTL